MMGDLAGWLKTLIVVVLLGNLVDFILPKGDLKRYGGLIVGLVILAAVVSPLWAWLHQLGKNVSLPSSTWTNSVQGFSQVVSIEELHQAEAIVLSMPGIRSCRLALEPGGAVMAQVVETNSLKPSRVRHYVAAALTVTMGKSPPLNVTLREGRDSIP